MTSYKLIYFDVRARAETIRMIFAAAGVQYEDCRISFEDWGKMKPTTTFGQLPILEVNGRPLPQSNAICRYLALVFGLAGQSAWDRGLVESVADMVNDIREEAIRLYFIKDENVKAEKLKEFGEVTLIRVFSNLERVIENNSKGGGWFVGNNMTWADLHFYTCVELLLSFFPDILQLTPGLKCLYDKIADAPKVKAYLEVRPVTTF